MIKSDSTTLSRSMFDMVESIPESDKNQKPEISSHIVIPVPPFVGFF